jgi:membrane protein involved in colicin uptake
MSSAIGDDPLLTKAAQQAGKSQAVQRDLDNLFSQLSNGNMNPGVGSKALAGTDVTYARGANGGRLSFRNADGGIQIVGKADKGKSPR